MYDFSGSSQGHKDNCCLLRGQALIVELSAGEINKSMGKRVGKRGW